MESTATIETPSWCASERRSPKSLEADVAHVPRVVVAGNDDHPLAGHAVQVVARRLVLRPQAVPVRSPETTTTSGPSSLISTIARSSRLGTKKGEPQWRSESKDDERRHAGFPSSPGSGPPAPPRRPPGRRGRAGSPPRRRRAHEGCAPRPPRHPNRGQRGGVALGRRALGERAEEVLARDRKQQRPAEAVQTSVRRRRISTDSAGLLARSMPGSRTSLLLLHPGDARDRDARPRSSSATSATTSSYSGKPFVFGGMRGALTSTAPVSAHASATPGSDSALTSLIIAAPAWSAARARPARATCPPTAAGRRSRAPPPAAPPAPPPPPRRSAAGRCDPILRPRR